MAASSVVQVMSAGMLVPICFSGGPTENRDEYGKGGQLRYSSAGGSESGGEDRGEREVPILIRDESWDRVMEGVRVTLSNDSAAGSSTGIVENRTRQTLRSAQVGRNANRDLRRSYYWSHLSNGVEYGPTMQTDVAPGTNSRVDFPATDQLLKVARPKQS